MHVAIEQLRRDTSNNITSINDSESVCNFGVEEISEFTVTNTGRAKIHKDDVRREHKLADLNSRESCESTT